MKGAAFAVLALLAGGCATMQPPPRTADADDELRAALMRPEHPRRGKAGGVFNPNAPWSLSSDSRAFRPGDVLTVMLQEVTQASKSADTRFTKESSVAISPLTLGTHTLRSNAAISAERDFGGGGATTQQNRLQGAITVVVIEVLPNGLLRVEGEKSLYLNQGEEFIRLSGYVRAGDIDSDNRVSSQRVANARISYAGQGALADANNAGWLTRLFASPWMPF
jgi:flagellar L-ring protein precursor FlgH